MITRPILFSGAMVRALLDGSKTQTRRALKVRCQEIGERNDGSRWPWSENPNTAGDHWHACPYGQPGDRLWVRETFLDTQGTGIEHRDESGLRHRYAFAADCAPGSYGDQARKDYGLKWKPSIHMPRAASRILLEIVSVRVERLQDISDEDAIAEGIEPNWCGDLSKGPNGFGGEGWVPDCGWINYLSGPDGEEAHTAVESYRTLWESINGAGSWEANPWVWVVEFKRVMA
jgi:hypothetical protein